MYSFLFCFILSLVLNTNSHIEIVHPVVGCCFFFLMHDILNWRCISSPTQTHMHKHTDDDDDDENDSFMIITHTHTRTHEDTHPLAHRQGSQRDAPVQSLSARCLNMIATYIRRQNTHTRTYKRACTHTPHSTFQTAPLCTGPTGTQSLERSLSSS